MKDLKQLGYLDSDYVSGLVEWDNDNSVTVTVCRDELDNLAVYVKYTQTNHYRDTTKSFNYPIQTTWSECNYGGRRYWFVCESYRRGQYCGRRVGILYMRDEMYSCRLCSRLAYESQQKTHTSFMSRQMNRLDKLIEMEEMADNMRVKKWRGRPTRRFAKILRYLGYPDRDIAL